MAGGKLTPRQKMINLMYLVFIAMLALNMSKEVLSAFGLMNEKFAGVNISQTEQNQKLAEVLANKAAEDEGTNFKNAYDISKQVDKASNELYNFLEDVKKKDILVDFPADSKGILPYEAMDKSNIDEKWFKGDVYKPRGQEIVAKIDDYRNKMKAALGKNVDYQSVLSKVDKLFGTGDVKDSEGVTKKYLDYHYKGFPAIATVAKLSAMQNDIKSMENEVYNVALGNSYKQAASMKTFQAIVALDKNVYFEGEKVTGKVVLGKYDSNTVPTAFEGPGSIENGQAVINATAGGIGEHPVKGSFTFMEDNKPVTIPFDGKYVVVPRPKSANVSADKMNVVYRGVDNPMTITFAGIPDSDVTASAPGMRKVGNGKYMLSPSSGTEVTINVTGKLPTGNVSDKKVFRIKGIPAPTGKIRGEEKATGPASSLASSTVSAVLEDFDFPVTVNVTGFNIKVPGQPTVVVSGNRLNGAAQAAVKKAMKGDVIVISDIKASFAGIGQQAKKVSACTYEIR
ncbi:gliding motility protein GldM [Flavobacterium sp.]|uniref:type IX secretion system motor protein PorM/GldM n=1 Tax=Flavobacterium sp. TaxID=239 RepID=UPI003528B0B8